ncbi:MAG: non-homologous end-joining DNA ligase [Zavarzinella sp.]|nr:non-homologous end-joining DNA ligase [Zavarzinella sp.]
MLASLAAEPFDHPDWIAEPKFDGLRVLVRFDGNRLTLISRNGKSQNTQFPEVADSLTRAVKKPAVLDGEVVCFDDRGHTSFRALQQRFHLLDEGEVRERAQKHPAYIYLFDVLYFDRFDVTGLPLRERKAVLDQAVKWSERVRPTPFTRGNGVAALNDACRRGEEGIIAKDFDGHYFSGRGSGWMKVKCVGRQEFVIGGFTDPQRSRVGLGALLVGYYDDLGRFTYAGKVGTGYTKEVLLELRDKLGRIESKSNPFAVGDPPRGAHVHWVRPKFVAEIGFAEWTQNGLLRQPRYEGLRTDKHPREIRRERPAISGEAIPKKG